MPSLNTPLDVWRCMPQIYITINTLCCLLLRPGSGAEYCDQLVCLFVCLSVFLSVREHICRTAGPILTKFCVHIPRGRGSVLLRRRCATLFTSGFMDDVMFGRNGPYGVAWPAWSAASRQLRAWPGRSLTSMDVCCREVVIVSCVFVSLYRHRLATRWSRRHACQSAG